jgi:hypothetical protein
MSIQKLEQRLRAESSIKLKFESENPALISLTAIIDPDEKFNTEDKLSQINTLQQLTHVASHGFLQKGTDLNFFFFFFFFCIFQYLYISYLRYINKVSS